MVMPPTGLALQIPRVILVIHGLGMGGAEMVVRNLACALYDMQIPVEVVSLCGAHTPIANFIREHGIEVVALEKHKGPDVEAMLKLKREMERFKPTVIHTHLPVMEYVFPASRFARCCHIVHSVHNMADKETSSALLKRVNQYAFQHGVIPVALNEEVRESICKVYRLAPTNVPIVHNGIELAPFRIAGEARRLSKRLRLICVARMEGVKNHTLLLDVLSVLSNMVGGLVHLTLLGDGPLRSVLEAKADQLGISELVSFEGRKIDTALFYGAADLFVLLSKFEGLPMSIIEAMASGLPVVATDVGGVSSIVRPGINGELVGFNAKAIAKTIYLLASNHTRYLELSKGARLTAEEFSAEKMAEGYLELYR